MEIFFWCVAEIVAEKVYTISWNEKSRAAIDRRRNHENLFIEILSLSLFSPKKSSLEIFTL